MLHRGGWAGGPDPLPGKSQVAKGFLSHTGTDPLEKQLDPSGPIDRSSCFSRGRSVRHVKSRR